MAIWNRQALSAYTWMRTCTEKGPQRSWLAKVNMADSDTCPCGHQRQDRIHLTFHCPRYRQVKDKLDGKMHAYDTWPWEALDDPLLIRDQEELEVRERYRDGTELFFSALFTQLT